MAGRMSMAHRGPIAKTEEKAAMTLYSWLVLGHILAAIIWVGGGTMELLLGRRLATTGGADNSAFAAARQWTGGRVFAPAAIAVLGFGILMVVESPAWSFGQLWVWLALVLAGSVALIGASYYGPEQGRITRLAAERGTDDSEVLRRRNRLQLVNHLEAVVMVAIVFLMVIKPGA